MVAHAQNNLCGADHTHINLVTAGCGVGKKSGIFVLNPEAPEFRRTVSMVVGFDGHHCLGSVVSRTHLASPDSDVAVCRNLLLPPKRYVPKVGGACEKGARGDIINWRHHAHQSRKVLWVIREMRWWWIRNMCDPRNVRIRKMRKD